MKLEIGESLGYSFLRHVKGCWLVQTNWKASEHWDEHRLLSDDDLEQAFSAMREKFDKEGSVFKGTQSGKQFLKQAEVDVLGVGLNRDIYAVEVAFHENGLQYGSRSETLDRVLKKMLRTKFLLDAYQLTDGKQHIYFASPKVHRSVELGLAEVFDRLKQEYPKVKWQLLTGEVFVSKLLVPTLKEAKDVADTSELFVRSAKLLDLGGLLHIGSEASSLHLETPSAPQNPESKPGRIQPLVQDLMQTLLDDFPSLLTESDRSNLTDKDYCRNKLGLKTAGRELLRQHSEGTVINGHRRYYSKVYAGRCLVTSEWWKQDHRHNAEALLRWVEELIRRNADQPEVVAALASHHADFRNYLGHPQ